MNYRILSLDGGGTWALIQVKALIAIYGADTSGHTILRDFDLVAANSGGSIVLGGLVENLTLGALLAFFESQAKRESVFSPTHIVVDRWLHDTAGLGPKYDAAQKVIGLEAAFPAKGAVPFTAAVSGLRRPGATEDIHLLITAFDYDHNRAAFFRSSPVSGPAWGTGDSASITLAQAIHASSNAPVNYFDAPALLPDGRYWDGALSGCNNPVLAAVIEAIGKRWDPMRFRVLSIGTASVALPAPEPGQLFSPYVRPTVKSDLLTDVHKLATSILDDPPDVATFLAHVMTGAGDGLNDPAIDSRVVRMNPLISPVKNAAGDWSAPGAMTEDQFNGLVNLDMDAVQQKQADAIASYADLWVQGIAPNQPIRMDGNTLARELGQTSFPDAHAAWNAIKNLP